MDGLFPYRCPRRVYCAGPLFNAAERAEMVRIASALAGCGFETFLPHADGMEFSLIRPYLLRWGIAPDSAGRLLHEAIFALDTYQVIVGCGCLVFNMNGRVPDEGAVAEATMAWMLGKPVVLYKEDRRSAIAGRDNPLVIGPAGFEVIADIDLLGQALEQKVSRLPTDAAACLPLPAHLEPILRAGERLWQRLQSADPEHAGDSNEAIARVVHELFAPVGSPCIPAPLGRLRPRTSAVAAAGPGGPQTTVS